ncbi:MAG TPA: outer membrane beta-barrel protein [Puia sp.]|nr:outer membrane beta-barrel protein [Puia sp.]
MKLTGLLLFVTLLSLTVAAQNDYAPGFVVKPNKDTLRGYLQKSLEEEFSQKVIFKTDVNASVQTFSPADLLGFGFDNNVYKSLSYQNIAEDVPVWETSFVKQLVRGQYDLYTLLKKERRFYIIKKDTVTYFLYSTVYSSGGEYQQQGNYSSRLVLLQRECEKLNANPQAAGFGQKEMSRFIFELDNCVAPGSAQTLYHPAKLVSELFIFAGGLPLGNNGQLTVEGQWRFSSPSLNKKTFLNIGIRYSYTTTSYTPDPTYYGLTFPTQLQNHEIISVPLTIQYNFFNGTVRPYIYAGFSGSYLYETTGGEHSNDAGFQKSFGFSLVAGGGIEVRVVKRLFVKADYHYELLSQYPAIGIAYQIK